MLEDKSEALERSLWAAVQTLDEKADLLKRLGMQATERHARGTAARFEKRSKEYDHHAQLLRNFVQQINK